MSAQIIPFVPRRSAVEQPVPLHRSLGLQEFAAACQKLAKSLRGLTEAARDAAVGRRTAKDGAEAIAGNLQQLDRLHAELFRDGRR